MRVAVIDIGTNTTRLLVADVTEGNVTEVERRTTVTTLGEGLDATGRLADSAMERVTAAVAEYREAIENGEGLEDWIASWKAEEDAFLEERREILLYPEDGA